MEKIQQYIVSFMPKYDRLLHFFVGFFVFVVFNIFFSNVTALLIVTIIATLKELGDRLIKKSNFDIIDLLYTILSGLILTILDVSL